MKYNKILFVGHSLSTFSSNILLNLRQFGVNVKMFDHYSPDIWAKILGIINNKFAKKNTLDSTIREYINHAFIKRVQSYQPDLVFIFKGKEISSQTILKLRNDGYKILNWYPDYFDDWSWISTHAQNYDYFFTPCEYVLSKLKKKGIKSYYIPFATEPDQIIGKQPKKYQTSFVGRYTKRRDKLFKKVYKAGLLDVWGYFHWQSSQYRNRYHGELSPIETLKIIRQSKITINTLTGIDEIPIRSVNYRVFEASGVGGFVLSSYHPPLENFFKIGKELDIFKSADEALIKTRFYLKNETLRNKIAYAGWQRTMKDHTYQRRLQTLFSYLA